MKPQNHITPQHHWLTAAWTLTAADVAPDAVASSAGGIPDVLYAKLEAFHDRLLFSHVSDAFALLML